MKKSFLILGVIGAIFMTNAYSASVGEVLGAGDRGWMACPPDCVFLRNANGGFSTPLTCVNHGVECAGGNSGIRFYDEYPTQYALGEIVEATKVEKKSVADKVVEKSESVSVARVAKVGAKAKKTIDTPNKPSKVQDMVADGGVQVTDCNCSPCEPHVMVLNNSSTGNGSVSIICSCVPPAGVTSCPDPNGKSEILPGTQK